MIESSLRLLVSGAFIAVIAGVFPLTVSAQVETVCIQCHSGQLGRLGVPVGEWQKSIHRENGISCNDCHGGDPTDFAMAMSPDSGFLGVPKEEEIPDFCGKCHVGIQEDYLRSAHGQALNVGGPQCVTCHGNHDIKKASLELINSRDCTRCHDYGRASDIRSALAEIDSRIAKLNKEISGLKKQGIDAKVLQGKTFALGNDFHRLFHTVKIALVKEKSDVFDSRVHAIEGDIEVIKEKLTARKMWGAGVIILLLLAGVLSLLLHKAYHGGD